MDIERKSVDAIVTPVEDSKSKHGEFDVILSTSDLDRDGDELYADEWKTPLPDKITFDSDHGMSVATCVGSGRPFINDDGQLQVRGTFASTPHGQSVRTLINEGHVGSVSVAFRNLPKTSKDAKPQRELLNGAFVVVPANPKAVVLSSKAVKDGANWRNDTMAAISDMFDNDPFDGGDQTHKTAYFQGVHDLAVKLGAGCPYSDPQATPDVLNGPGNRSLPDGIAEHKRYTLDEFFAFFKQHETESSPTESTDSAAAAAAEESAAAAEESADDVALLAKKLAIQQEANTAAAL